MDPSLCSSIQAVSINLEASGKSGQRNHQSPLSLKGNQQRIHILHQAQRKHNALCVYRAVSMPRQMIRLHTRKRFCAVEIRTAALSPCGSQSICAAYKRFWIAAAAIDSKRAAAFRIGHEHAVPFADKRIQTLFSRRQTHGAYPRPTAGKHSRHQRAAIEAPNGSCSVCAVQIVFSSAKRERAIHMRSAKRFPLWRHHCNSVMQGQTQLFLHHRQRPFSFRLVHRMRKQKDAPQAGKRKCTSNTVKSQLLSFSGGI